MRRWPLKDTNSTQLMEVVCAKKVLAWFLVGTALCASHWIAVSLTVEWSPLQENVAVLLTGVLASCPQRGLEMGPSLTLCVLTLAPIRTKPITAKSFDVVRTATVYAKTPIALLIQMDRVLEHLIVLTL
jgi:hypothetical protein